MNRLIPSIWRLRSYVPSVDSTVQRVMDNYVSQALDSCNMVNTVMLNSTLNAYKKIVDDTASIEEKLAYDQLELNAEAGAVITGAKSRQQAVSDALANMSRNGITGFVDRAGREWEAGAYINMDIRTTAANAAREAAFQRNADYGNNLISVSAHAGARPLCYPYQGKVFSTDGTSGVTEDLNGQKIPYVPLESTSYGQPAGLFGINCGHFNYPFIPGLSLIRANVQPQDENDKAYKLSQQQRAQERKIRALKTEADALAASGDAEGAKKARKAARERNAALKAWCEENGRDYKADRLRVTKVSKEPQSDAGSVAKEPGNVAESAFSAEHNNDKVDYKGVLTNGINTDIIGLSEGYYRRREHQNSGAFAVLQEPITLGHVKRVMRQMGILDKSVEYKVDANEELIGTGFLGHTSPDGKTVTFYPDAFSDREQLVKTGGHESVHVRQVRGRGIALDSEELSWRENEAKNSETGFWEDYKKRMKLK